MKRITAFMLAAIFAIGLAPAAFADEVQQQPAKPKGPSKLLGPPVNIAISGGGLLPQGILLTAVNASFRDKTDQVKGSNSPDVFSQIWLLKVRYGLLDRLEINTVGSYVNNERSGTYAGFKHIEGVGDQSIGFSYALLSQRAGDPLWATFSGSLLLPTAPYGKNHIPGAGTWGGRASLGLTKWFTPNIKGDMDLTIQGPFERGNQKVERGSEYQWNVQMRYLFDKLPFDIGLESSLTKVESGNKDLPTGRNIDIHNGTTEWVVGPSVNVAIEPLGMWAGVGAFFPVMQEAKGPTKMEDVRWEFKVGKIW